MLTEDLGWAGDKKYVLKMAKPKGLPAKSEWRSTPTKIKFFKMELLDEERINKFLENVRTVISISTMELHRESNKYLITILYKE